MEDRPREEEDPADCAEESQISSPEPPFLHPESPKVFFGYCAPPSARERFNWTVSRGGLDQFNRQFETDLNHLVNGADCDQNWLFEEIECRVNVQIYPEAKKPPSSPLPLRKPSRRTDPALKREYNRRYMAKQKAKKKQLKEFLKTKVKVTSTTALKTTKKKKIEPFKNDDSESRDHEPRRTRSSRLSASEILEHNRRMQRRYRCESPISDIESN